MMPTRSDFEYAKNRAVEIRWPNLTRKLSTLNGSTIHHVVNSHATKPKREDKWHNTLDILRLRIKHKEQWDSLAYWPQYPDAYSRIHQINIQRLLRRSGRTGKGCI